jgi:hypothetical protein
MGYKKGLVRQTLNNSQNSLTNQELSGDGMQLKEEIDNIQMEIDTWNTETTRAIDDTFSHMRITGGDIVVRLFKENFIKGIDELNDGSIIYDAYIGQVEAQRIGQGKTRWIDNPLPYLFAGVVVAISPEVKFEQAKKLQEMKDFDAKHGTSFSEEFKPLEPGMVVNLTWHDRQRDRFYLNKQKIDLIKNPEEFNIDNYEGYVKVAYQIVESVFETDLFYNKKVLENG